MSEELKSSETMALDTETKPNTQRVEGELTNEELESVSGGDKHVKSIGD